MGGLIESEVLSQKGTRHEDYFFYFGDFNDGFERSSVSYTSTAKGRNIFSIF